MPSQNLQNSCTIHCSSYLLTFSTVNIVISTRDNELRVQLILLTSVASASNRQPASEAWESQSTTRCHSTNTSTAYVGRQTSILGRCATSDTAYRKTLPRPSHAQ